MIRFISVVIALGILGALCCAAQGQSGAVSSASSAAGSASSSGSVQQRSAAAPTDSSKVRIGRVGKVCVASAKIYKTQSTKGGVYSTVKKGVPLAIVKEEGNWYGVLMSTGVTGWIARQNVEMTDYELMVDRSAYTRGGSVSRGSETIRSAAENNAIIQTALQYWGVPYVYGGTSTSGMDCSAFVQSVFRAHGVKLPRTSREQAQVGTAVPVDQLQPGDRLYFACNSPHVDHCGIYAGNGYFIHCAKSRGGVAVDSLASNYYWRSLVTARR